MTCDLPHVGARSDYSRVTRADMTPLILTWQQAFEAGLLTCGGKGYHLAQLHRYGFPVPNGGVVAAGVYRQLMQAPGLEGLQQTLTSLRAEDVIEPTVQEQLAQL